MGSNKILEELKPNPTHVDYYMFGYLAEKHGLTLASVQEKGWMPADGNENAIQAFHQGVTAYREQQLLAKLHALKTDMIAWRQGVYND